MATRVSVAGVASGGARVVAWRAGARVSSPGRTAPGRRARLAAAACGGRSICGCADCSGWSKRAGKCYTLAPWRVSCERSEYVV